jgi:pilus assembly protein CpaC
MRRTTLKRLKLLAGVAAVAGVIGGTAAAQPPAKPLAAAPAEAKLDRFTGAVIAPLGNLVKYDPKTGKAISGIAIANEEIVAATTDVENPKLLSLTAKKEGLTKVTIQFADKTTTTIDVLVQPDYELLRKILQQTVPTANVVVTPAAGGAIILSGYVNRAEDADIVVRIATSAVGGQTNNVVNALQIGGVQHVLIDMVIAQVDRSEIRERGVSFGVGGASFGISSVLGGLATSSFSGGTGATGGFGGIGPTAQANLVVGIVPANTTAALRALRTEGLAKFVSEPKVITQSGRPAFLRVGGQQAILGPSSGINGPGAVLKEVGTQMEVLPIVFGNGKIYLEVNPQFTSVNAGRGLTTAFGFTPGFNESSIRSSVYMEPGQTYAIGGLLESQVQATSQKVPYFGDVPYIGSIFSNIRHEERETELVILVTPHLVDAMDCTQVPTRVPGKETRSPDDYEVFMESILEAPRGQRRPWGTGKFVPAYKNSPTAGMFPCVGPDGAVIPGCMNPAPGMPPQGQYLLPAPGSTVAPTTMPAPAAAPAPAGVTPAPLPAMPGEAAPIVPLTIPPQ